ncbi:hypothetical protein [Ramlibacter sp. Leaf400]|uniref:hypothetical protein n=1 Tax=Ramlibacter sp. Leaf400 TaxID=1736365 RepID=UPI0006F95860|nr:hypothetical protein [Ramlibacter sp. Leaf400]KQT09296.1 hypothetical protein ASG30_11980 [Ramlibacter sp. Leaf400]
MKKKQRRGAIALLTTTAAVATLIACGGGGGGGSAAAGASGDIPAGSTIAAPAPGTGAGATGPAPVLADCELFPQEAVFNTRIDDTSRFPAHANSAAWIASVGTSTPFRADWWRGEDPTQRDAYYGMPVNVVDGSAATTSWNQVQYDFSPSGVSSQVGWPHESDCAVADGAGGHTLTRGCSAVPADQRRFPFPRTNVKNEGGTCHDPNSCGDHHVLVVEQGACRLWEGYATYPIGGQWYTMSSAAWDLKSLALRPSGWTAGDAAGLPITPFLAKAAEADTGEIRHALRVTFRDAVLARSFNWPARHFAGGDTPGGIPFGAVLRLKADFAIPDHWTPQAKAIATAAKRYGLYVSDIGMDFYVQGEPNAAWSEQMFRDVSSIPLSQMEFVDLGAITRDPRFSADSMAARW